VPGEIPVDEGRVIEQPPQRKRLLEALNVVDQGLADMYDGATRMIDDPDFPDCLSLGAHAMRELWKSFLRCSMFLRVRTSRLETGSTASRRPSRRRGTSRAAPHLTAG